MTEGQEDLAEVETRSERQVKELRNHLQQKDFDMAKVRATRKQSLLRPPLNKKLFPVLRLSGLKRADWNSFFSFSNIFFFFTFFPVYSSLKKMKLGKKKNSRPPDCPFFCPPGPQETIFYLRMASK